MVTQNYPPIPLLHPPRAASNKDTMSQDESKDSGGDSPATTTPVQTEQPETSKEYKQLIEYGLDPKVAGRLDEIFKTEKLLHSDLDDRALDALKEFPSEGALAVLSQFLESNLEHVSNKSAYLCGVMKTYRQKTRARGGDGAGAGASSSGAGAGGEAKGAAGEVKGPDEAKIKEILERTGYSLDVTTGQRKFGGPPPGWEGEPPGNGCEVFCGKIPRDVYESDLIPLFEKCGPIWDLRLMMDPMTGLNRGYAFVTFTTRDAAQEAVRQLDSHELGEGKTLKVNVSEPKTRLFIGNIPKSKDREDIEDEFQKMAAGLREVIIYSSPDDKKKNRGFCFLEYESHKAASLAKRRLETGRVKVWNCDIIVDWADPQEEPDEHTMSQVKVLYVRNLTAMVSEDKIRETFLEHGNVERVKKIKDYAFVHFEDRSQAVAAMNALNGTELNGSELEISLAKPPSDKKKKEEMLRKREQRMMRAISHNLTLPPFPFAGAFPGPMGGPAAAALFRGAVPGGQGGGRGGAGGNPGWHWGGWGGDGSWHNQRGGGGAGPMTPWMGAAAASENWGHHHGAAAALANSGGGSGGRGGNYAWGNGGAGVNGNVVNYNNASGGGGGQRNRKGYTAR